MSPSAPSVAVAGPRLGRLQTLQVKLGALFVTIAVLLCVAAYFIGRSLVHDKLATDTGRHQRESGLRLVQAMEFRLGLAQALGNSLAEMTADSPRAGWHRRVPALVAGSGLGPLVVGVGIWPEPRTLDRRRERTSQLWVADSAGVLQLREDYNDPRAIAYWEEPWYTPARRAPSGSCFWTTVFRETLTMRDVVACALPLRDSSGFAGVVTVLIGLEGLQNVLSNAARGQNGYALLVDRDNGLLAMSDALRTKLDGHHAVRNVAALAQQLPSINALALDLHRRNEALLSRAVQSPLYDPAQISELTQQTREGSRRESESALALIWSSGMAGPAESAPVRELRIADDGVLDAPSSATVFELPGPFWKLVRVTPAQEGLAGAEYVFGRTLVLVCGALLLALALIFGAIRWLVLRPLSRITGRIADARTVEESLHIQLDASGHNEISLIGHWYNERLRQLREAMDRTLTQQVQIAAVASERTKADDQALRLRERASALLASVSDAVIVVDPRGLVEDMNAAAERLTSTTLRNVRGKPSSEVFRARIAARGGSQSDFAAAALAAPDRIEHSEGLFLHVEGRPEREIRLTASALRGPSGRILGAILVFHPREAQQASTPRVMIDRRSVDSLTALPTRAACERRLRALIESTRLQPRAHALIVADIDRMRAINESAGQRAGDELLVRIGETLVGSAPGADVFRLGGDAFAIVLEGADAEGAYRAASLLRECVAATRLLYEERPLTVTASFGIASFDSPGERPTQLLRRAGDACTAAKAAGRNAVIAYDPSMDRNDEIAEEATWVRRIRTGLGEGLFHLTTQWVLPADRIQPDGAVFDVSLALEDEEGFWAEPSVFLPVAERAGLVGDVERWALRQALDHLARNPEVLPRLAFCCVPLSAQTVSEGATLELLAQALQQHEILTPGKLCFVLREGVLSEVPGPAQTFCEAMRSLGCRVAVDHFDGHSGATADMVRRLPAEILRIDARHFVDLSGDAVDQLIADSLIRLARTLSRRVLVSEIGDDAARESWQRLGADYLQGIAVARPSPVLFAASA